MIVLNIKELCKQRGIKHPHAALTRAGITNTVATDYLKPKKDRFLTQDIELLCNLLRCTPNDLFKWVPDEPQDDYPENPLQQIRKQDAFNLEEKLKGNKGEGANVNDLPYNTSHEAGRQQAQKKGFRLEAF